MRPVTLIVLLGCGGPSVSGRIDGAGVGAGHAYFVGDRVWISDVSCEDQAAYLAGLEDVDGPEAQADLWARHHPGRFWEIVVDLADESADVAHYLRNLDVGYWDATGEAEYTARYVSDGGALTLDTQTDSAVAGRFVGPVVRVDGEGGGEIDVSFDAAPCAALE